MTLRTATQFRGLSGDIVSHFVHPGVWLTLMPVYGIWLLLLIVSYLFNPSGEVTFLLSLVISAWIVGRYAIPASQGEIDTGFFSENCEMMDSVQFAFRALAFTFVWELPLYGIMQVTGSSISVSALSNPTSLMGAGFVAILNFIFLLLVVIGPLMCCILATATHTFSAVFTALPYKWLYSRISDVPAIVAAAIGGWLVFFFLYLPPVLLICGGIASQSMEGALIAGFLVFLIPSASMPVLIGRLCGAFVYGNNLLAEKMSAEVFVVDDPDYEGDELPTPESQIDDTPQYPEFSPLSVDPSQEVIDWTKSNLASLEQIELAYVYLRSMERQKPQICIGMTTTEGLRLGDISQLKKILSGLSCPFLYELLTPESLPEAQKHGMMIFKRKTS